MFNANPSGSLFGNQIPSAANFGSKPIAEAAPLEQAIFKAPNQSVFAQSKPVTGLFGNSGAAAAPSGGVFSNATKPIGGLFGATNAPV